MQSESLVAERLADINVPEQIASDKDTHYAMEDQVRALTHSGTARRMTIHFCSVLPMIYIYPTEKIFSILKQI